jgi:phenylacetate-CoA ligase
MAASEILIAPLRGHLFLGLQRLRSRPLGRYLQQLAEWERLTPAELDELHGRHLHALIAYARTHVPLYRTARWRDAVERSGDTLDGWPVLERELVRSHFEELRGLPDHPWQMQPRTSGSTGKPVRVVLTLEAETWTWAHRYRALMWHGVPIGARTLRLTHDRHLLRDRLLGHGHLPMLGTTPDLERAVRFLRRERPTMVMGPPSAMFHLARYLGETGVREPLVRLARAGGEQLFDFQRAEIESRLAERAMTSYGCTEIGAVASECPAGSLHVHSEHVHVEIMRGGEPVEVGEFGDIVLTTLVNPAMPLVRYRVGDRGRLSPDRCRCGLPHPILVDLQARSSDAFPLADGSRRHASELVDQLGEFFADPAADRVRQVQFEQLAPTSWRAWVEAPAAVREADAGAACGEAVARSLVGIVRRAFGPECLLEARVVERIDRQPGKFRYYRLGAETPAPDAAPPVEAGATLVLDEPVERPLSSGTPT